MYLTYTITGRRNFFLVSGVKKVRLISAAEATRLMESGLELFYR